MMGEDFSMRFDSGFMWLFWSLLVIVIAWVLKAAAGSSNNPSEKQKSALDMLKERYARGEIDQDEYETRRKNLVE